MTRSAVLIAVGVGRAAFLTLRKHLRGYRIAERREWRPTDCRIAFVDKFFHRHNPILSAPSSGPVAGRVAYAGARLLSVLIHWWYIRCGICSCYDVAVWSLPLQLFDGCGILCLALVIELTARSVQLFVIHL